MFNIEDLKRDEFMLDGPFARKGYDWWWHSLTARDAETGEEKPFFFEAFTINPALGGKEPVFGQLLANKAAGIKPSYLMIKAGCWGVGARQLHRFFGWDDVTIHKGAPFAVTAGDCYLTENRFRGSVCVSKEESIEHPEYMCGYGTIEWDLEIDKHIPFNVGYGASMPLRFMKAFEMYWHVGGMKTAYKGTITLDGRKYIVSPENCFGYADKNWGSNFTSPWVWLSSNDLTSKITGKRLENSAFDIGGGRPKVYFAALDRQLLSAFWYEGEEFEFNFSKFWKGLGTKFDCRETVSEIQWHVRQESVKAVVDVKVRCKKEDMLLINYESPDGMKRHNRLWNGGNGIGKIALYRKVEGGRELVDDIIARHIGCEYGEYDPE